YRTTEFLIFRQFHSYRRLLTLVDDQLAIDRSSVNQMALLYLLQRFDDFFWRFIPRMEIHFLKKWDSHIAKKHMSKHESEIHLSERMVHGHRLYLMHKRMESETLLSRQKIFREEVQKNEELTRGLDMAKLEEELKEVNIIEFEEAVMIIQCAERMYQAIARYVYLTDVRKKAMDLHNETKTFDTEQAVIKIQA
ncbi:ATPase, partial [Aphelenchoides avenae]